MSADLPSLLFRETTKGGRQGGRNDDSKIGGGIMRLTTKGQGNLNLSLLCFFTSEPCMLNPEDELEAVTGAAVLEIRSDPLV